MRQLVKYVTASTMLLLTACSQPQSASTETSKAICSAFERALTPDDGFLPSRKDTQLTADWVLNEQARNNIGRKLQKAACK